MRGHQLTKGDARYCWSSGAPQCPISTRAKVRASKGAAPSYQNPSPGNQAGHVQHGVRRPVSDSDSANGSNCIRKHRGQSFRSHFAPAPLHLRHRDRELRRARGSKELSAIRQRNTHPATRSTEDAPHPALDGPHLRTSCNRHSGRASNRKCVVISSQWTTPGIVGATSS